MSSFLDALSRLHRHYGRRPGVDNLSLRDLLKRFPAGEGDGLSNKTLNRHLSALSKMAKWARKRGHVPAGVENPFSDQMREAAANPYRPLTVAELNKLFLGLSFDVKPKRHSLASSWPWLMAIALFSGLRLGEIANLDVEDIKRDGRVRYFDVTEAKSVAGVRVVSVHSKLIGLGLLDYVKAVGSGPLFPGLKPGGRGASRGEVVAKRFPEFRRGRGVDRAGVTFHSFRKSFVQALEKAGIDRDRAALVVAMSAASPTACTTPTSWGQESCARLLRR